MIPAPKRVAAFGSTLGAIAIVAAGCGGAVSGSAAGHTATASAHATTHGHGGVLGAQASLGSGKLQLQAGDVQQTLGNLVSSLTGVNGSKQLAQASGRARRHVQRLATELQKLDLSNAQAKQARTNLVNALQGLDSNLATVQTDAQNGNLTQALQAASNLDFTQVRNALQQVASLNGSALQSLGTGLATRLEQALVTLPAINTKQGLVKHIDRLLGSISNAQQRLANTTVPQAAQQTKQQLQTFLSNWKTDLQSARTHAQQGQLAQARQQAVGLTLQDIQSLLGKLYASHTGGGSTTTTTSTATG